MEKVIKVKAVSERELQSLFGGSFTAGSLWTQPSDAGDSGTTKTTDVNTELASGGTTIETGGGASNLGASLFGASADAGGKPR